MKKFRYKTVELGTDQEGYATFTKLDATDWDVGYAVLNIFGNPATGSASFSALFDNKEDAVAYQKGLLEIDKKLYTYVEEVKQHGDILAFPEMSNYDNKLPDAVKYPKDYKAARAALLAASDVMKAVPYTGGCTTFYTTQKWADRKEEYGIDSEVIICHDGGDFSALCNYSECEYTLLERFSKKMEKAGYCIEQCTCWYSAVYKIKK